MDRVNSSIETGPAHRLRNANRIVVSYFDEQHIIALGLQQPVYGAARLATLGALLAMTAASADRRGTEILTSQLSITFGERETSRVATGRVPVMPRLQRRRVPKVMRLVLAGSEACSDLYSRRSRRRVGGELARMAE